MNYAQSILNFDKIEFLRNYNNIKLFGAGFKYPVEVAEELEKEYEKARSEEL